MITFSGISQTKADSLRRGAVDANQQFPETQVSDGNGNPCRACLQMIARDDPFLVFAHRPFDTINPYTEVGPVFMHKHQCSIYRSDSEVIPAVLKDSNQYILRGYNKENRIMYGTGQITPQEEIIPYARSLFENPSIEFVHVRSATNNCWQARIDR